VGGIKYGPCISRGTISLPVIGPGTGRSREIRSPECDANHFGGSTGTLIISPRPLYRKGYFDPRSKSVRVRATNERGSLPASRVGEIIVPRTVRASSRRLARSNGDTVEAPTFSSSNGNNLNSRRDDEELFPRVILESDAYYYQTASPVALSPSPSLCDLYRSRGKGGRGAKRQERNL